VAQEIVYHRSVIGFSESYREIIIEQYGDGEDVLAILSTLHGSESAGTPLSLHLASNLMKNPELVDNKTVILIHVTNPDGMVAKIRGNRNNIDINRNFPTDNFGRGFLNGKEPLSAVETQIIVQFIEQYEPERMLVIHQPVNCIDFDGDAQELAAHLSDVSGMRIKRLGSRSGSLGTYFSRKKGKSIITLELPSSASTDTSVVLWDKYGELLIAFIAFPFESD
jgi:murein peptide amidase A